MKVFGIGLNKTGTSSLGHALRILGFKNHVDGRPDLLKAWANGQVEPILAEATKFNNFEDWPWPLVYQELFDAFPDSRFILTTRSSSEIWFNSLCKHADKTGPTQQRKLVYGFDMPHDHRDEHIDFYNQHNANVISFFEKYAPEKLLKICWEDGQNWEKLCAFLELEVPEVDFPHVKPFVDAPKKESSKSPSIWKRWFSPH